MTLIFGLIVAAAATGAPPALDQSDYSPQATRRLLADYGRCIVKRSPRLAAEAIARNVDNGELVKHYNSLVDGTCLPSRWFTSLRVRFVGDQYRYALADALVARDLAQMPVPDFEGVPLLDHRDPGPPPTGLDKKGRPLKPAQLAAAQRLYEEAQAFHFLSRFGECAVRTNPAGAKALLLTKPETTEESAQFAALSTAFATCLPEGRTMRLGKLALRGTVAINYYRLATAAAAKGAPR